MSIIEIYEQMSWGPAPEGADLANEWLDRHDRKFGHYIDGTFVAPSEGVFFPTFHPASGKPLGEVAQGSDMDVSKAVLSAKVALKEWQAIGGYRRAQYLYAVARQIQKHARLFAVLETLDNGKPIRETRDLDIPLVVRHFYHHAGWAEAMESEMPGWEPIGVCGQIIPWNFPLLMLAWKIAPALAMGNTVVLKPAEYTPLSALLFAEICDRVGLPRGVVNIVTGDGETGRYLVEHPDVDKIAFTGSTEVGRLIRKATAGTGKGLSLELGGKSPFLIFEDSDLDSAVEGLVDAIWFNQGQVCCAGSRLLVQESVSERVFKKIRARMERLRIGDPLDKAIDIGAIVAPVQLERITALVEQGVREGAEIFQPSAPCPKDGWFYPPTLLTNVSPASTVAQVEIFGPVLVGMTFRTPKEAVEVANNTPYGLAASVWTENVNLAHDVAAKLKAGTVWVNCTNLFDAASGFGGYRESGFGREGGREGLYSYVRRTASNLPTPETSNWPEDDGPAPAIDRTHKLFIGGKQARPDSGYSLTIGTNEFGRGNRKDLRNAVEAARGAQAGWAANSSHGRAQVMYYFAENLQALGDEEAMHTVFSVAARCDKMDGACHSVPMRALCYAINEPIGVIGIVCSDGRPLSGLLELACGAISMGNTVVVIPSETDPLPAVELYRVLEASDVPAGVFNIVTGLRSELVSTLAEHMDVDAVWCLEPDWGVSVERLSVSNLKQTWVGSGRQPVETVLRHAVQVKNVWVPYGE
ncbi:MAG: aldehyde dehydrogenase family protein [Fimbriimonas sp.]|nr:aldehyde dehydrogenase family protein [Fimbriimonas sp.]